MIDRDFGTIVDNLGNRVNIDPNEYLMEFIGNTKGISSTDADIILYDLYEMNYGIFNHRNASKTKPLSSVALHECENIGADSNLYKVIEAYVSRGVKEVTGLTLTEYLELPTDICIKIMEICSADSAAKTKIFDNLNNINK